MYDMKDGNDEGLISPCDGGAIGYWDTEEPATKYPGGPSDGLVLTSSQGAPACLDTPTTVAITRGSFLYIGARVPYTTAEVFTVWLVKTPELWREWFSVQGPVDPGKEWIQEEISLPNDVPDGDYVVNISSGREQSCSGLKTNITEQGM
jgi:hypothetical protein